MIWWKISVTNLWHHKLNSLQLGASPACRFYHESFNTLENQLCSFGTPNNSHFLKKVFFSILLKMLIYFFVPLTSRALVEAES